MHLQLDPESRPVANREVAVLHLLNLSPLSLLHHPEPRIGRKMSRVASMTSCPFIN